MRELILIGIGTGNPDHLTLQGATAIRTADLILVPRKGADKADLADLRRAICARVLGGDDARIVEFDLPKRDSESDYLAGVEAWHDAIARAWGAAAGPAAERVALLIWGDPSLYDSSLRIAARLSPPPKVSVVPGITALQALCAAHGIPLNEIGAPFLVTTGRRLRDEGWPDCAGTLVVMLDGSCAFQTLDPTGVTIWWGAYLGMAEEVTVSGPMAEVGPKIVEMRAEARARHGWIMDIYLMRRATEG
ncbi:precorrin-6A synthase (deacetylating) [Rhodovulum sp. ES.010]|uniref:precorrin-6A synthase (deacetylating) n=1 Tax=Rhodovulum sp. ES.010 TaxID=1882821 RepID=UPI0009265B3A|nr:precorrin-6A synthase (deacetylating) [Rhodovulum sp. ES.010]SIO32604.1 precorrin-6A synthase (deacetylating) [Rhodovulum sp. ES.010]